jgi:hypothetical protein
VDAELQQLFADLVFCLATDFDSSHFAGGSIWLTEWLRFE